MPVECGGDAGEGTDPVPGPAAFLEARDHRLDGVHPLGELALTIARP